MDAIVLKRAWCVWRKSGSNTGNGDEREGLPLARLDLLVHGETVQHLDILKAYLSEDVAHLGTLQPVAFHAGVLFTAGDNAIGTNVGFQLSRLGMLLCAMQGDFLQ